ncbi:hypothetical protein [Sinomonas notoginsengisoli]
MEYGEKGIRVNSAAPGARQPLAHYRDRGEQHLGKEESGRSAALTLTPNPLHKSVLGPRGDLFTSLSPSRGRPPLRTKDSTRSREAASRRPIPPRTTSFPKLGRGP